MFKHSYLFKHQKTKQWRVRLVYLASFLFTITVALISYYQSAFMNQYVSEAQIGTYISLAYIISLISLFLFNRVIKKVGYILSIILVVALNIIGLILMAYYDFAWAAILGVIIYEVCLTLIYLCFDILLKQNTENQVVGSTRGFYLTIIILAWILSPAIAGYLVTQDSYSILFKISIVLMLAVGLLFTLFGRLFKAHDHENFRIDFKKIYQNADLFKIFIISFFLNVFLCGLVIYSPLYLLKDMGFDWEQIGIIFTVMLFAYLIIEYPAGKMADKYCGEKEMLIAGIIIASISALLIFYNPWANFWVWLGLMFLTRVGSSLIEIMSETYFFTKINEREIGVINFYRTASPLAYIFAPLFFSALLYFYPLKIVFLALGIIMLLPLYWAATLKDTK